MTFGAEWRPQVVENWNSANTVIFYGKDGALAGDDREHAEVSILTEHALQSALVRINTLLAKRCLRCQPSTT